MNGKKTITMLRSQKSIEEYLRGCLGVQKTPLAYVIHDDIAIPAVDPTGGYPSRQDELITRAPIQDNANQFTATYLNDRNRVWEKLSELTRDHECWSYVRPAQRNHDGRLAFSGLKGHYLGVNNVDNMSSKAERKLQTTTYTGEKCRWNFEKYVRVHIDLALDKVSQRRTMKYTRNEQRMQGTQPRDRLHCHRLKQIRQHKLEMSSIV